MFSIKYIITMNTFLKKDIRSALFVLSLTFFGTTLAYFITNDIGNSQRLGYIFTLIGSFLTSLSIGISIAQNRSKF
jgi:uncharacterized membrane protein YoaT (DUF817 family)